MKRMIAFIFMVFVLIGVAFFKQNNTQQYDFEKVVIVSKVDNLINCDVIKNGNDYYYTIKSEEKSKVDGLNKTDIDAIIYYLPKDLKIDYFKAKFDFNISNPSYVAGRTIFYGYDKNFNDFRLINGKKINFQLACDENNWILGYPMIVTGF